MSAIQMLDYKAQPTACNALERFGWLVQVAEQELRGLLRHTSSTSTSPHDRKRTNSISDGPPRKAVKRTPADTATSGAIKHAKVNGSRDQMSIYTHDGSDANKSLVASVEELCRQSLGKRRVQTPSFQLAFQSYKDNIRPRDGDVLKEAKGIIHAPHPQYSAWLHRVKVAHRQDFVSSFIIDELLMARKRFRDRQSKRLSRQRSRNDKSDSPPSTPTAMSPSSQDGAPGSPSASNSHQQPSPQKLEQINQHQHQHQHLQSAVLMGTTSVHPMMAAVAAPQGR